MGIEHKGSFSMCTGGHRLERKIARPQLHPQGIVRLKLHPSKQHTVGFFFFFHLLSELSAW